MNVDLYERIWMWGVGIVLAGFFGTMAFATISSGMAPPSHIETIDPNPATVMTDPRVAPQGVSQDADGHVHVRMVGLTFAWLPNELTVPANTPVTFHLTSTDVVHGFEIVRTNGQTTVVPGYISQFTTTFDPGEYLIACNEYCGVGHQTMSAKLTVVPAASWTADRVAAPTPEVADAH